jgi:hypothetical protein
MDTLLEVVESSPPPGLADGEIAQDRVQLADGDVQSSLATRPRLRNPFTEPLSPGAEVRKPSALRHAVSSTGKAGSSDGRQKADHTVRVSAAESANEAASGLFQAQPSEPGAEDDQPQEKARALNPFSNSGSNNINNEAAKASALHASNPFAMFETDV